MYDCELLQMRLTRKLLASSHDHDGNADNVLEPHEFPLGAM